jgi:hypothetical protein
LFHAGGARRTRRDGGVRRTGRGSRPRVDVQQVFGEETKKARGTEIRHRAYRTIYRRSTRPVNPPAKIFPRAASSRRSYNHHQFLVEKQDELEALWSKLSTIVSGRIYRN